MKTEEVKKIMKSHLIGSEEEGLEAIEFVRELLELSVKKIEENEPYATNTIRELRVAIQRVDTLSNEAFDDGSE